MRTLSSTSLGDWVTVERFFLDALKRDRLAGRQMTPLERVAMRSCAHVADEVARGLAELTRAEAERLYAESHCASE